MAAGTPATPAALEADVAVVGAGAAGLYTTLCASRAGARVALVSSSPLAQSASYWAQGGVAAALAADDSPELHAHDTEAAGRGTARRSAVEALAREAPDCVHDLEQLGVRFDPGRDGQLALGLEGGHTRRRIVHAGGSATGRRITRCLSAEAASDPRVEVLEEATATRLLVAEGRCVGLIAVPAGAGAAGGPEIEVRARAIVLATGGAAALWERTTNPPGAVGAGLMLAAAAGARLADLEFVQFHPTALATGGPRDGFLLTEALRGEGAVLLDDAGERFVDELAPRDEVALAVQARLRARPGAQVWLDLRDLDTGAFPNVVAALHEAGLDPRHDLVPVAPAAHYTIGGVATDLAARSRLPGLLAVGECATTGLHGANRLASNSLAECLVFGRRAAGAALAEPASPRTAVHRAEPPGEVVAPPPSRDTRRALWQHAGIERTADGLRALADDPFPLARSIAAAALARSETRGAHRRLDRPDADPALDSHHIVISEGGPATAERWT